jgi:hypothetical protein
VDQSCLEDRRRVGRLDGGLSTVSQILTKTGMGKLAGPLSATNERARAGELFSSAGRCWGRIEKLYPASTQHRRLAGGCSCLFRLIGSWFERGAAGVCGQLDENDRG